MLWLLPGKPWGGCGGDITGARLQGGPRVVSTLAFIVGGMNLWLSLSICSLSHRDSALEAWALHGRKGSVWAGGLGSHLCHQPDVSLEVSCSVGLGRKEVEGARAPELFCIKGAIGVASHRRFLRGLNKACVPSCRLSINIPHDVLARPWLQRKDPDSGLSKAQCISLPSVFSAMDTEELHTINLLFKKDEKYFT